MLTLKRIEALEKDLVSNKPLVNKKYVESTTTITTDRKALDNVTQTHENQASNKMSS
jgi:hypothetical protein